MAHRKERRKRKRAADEIRHHICLSGPGAAEAADEFIVELLQDAAQMTLSQARGTATCAGAPFVGLHVAGWRKGEDIGRTTRTTTSDRRGTGARAPRPATRAQLGRRRRSLSNKSTASTSREAPCRACAAGPSTGPGPPPLALRDLLALAIRHGEGAAQPAARLAAELGPARRVADARVEGKPDGKAAREFQKDGADRVHVDGRRRRRPQSLWMCNALRRAVLGRRPCGRRPVSCAGRPPRQRAD